MKTRTATLKVMLSALKRLPSREIYPGAYVSFSVQDKPEEDCRYCVKGLAAAVSGSYVGTERPRYGSIYYGPSPELNQRVLDVLETRAFSIARTVDGNNSYNSAETRRKIWLKLVEYIERQLRRAKAIA